jgi:ketosteroid isomerase-like protein
MTPSANVAFVRSICAAWERGDYSSAEWAHPQIEFGFADGPEPGSSTGLAGMAQAMHNWLSAWERVHVEADEYRELGDEQVLVLAHHSGRGKTSRLEIGHAGARNAMLFRIREGKVTSLVLYWDRDRALADLGLTPQGESPDS